MWLPLLRLLNLLLKLPKKTNARSWGQLSARGLRIVLADVGEPKRGFLWRIYGCACFYSSFAAADIPGCMECSSPTA